MLDNASLSQMDMNLKNPISNLQEKNDNKQKKSTH